MKMMSWAFSSSRRLRTRLSRGVRSAASTVEAAGGADALAVFFADAGRGLRGGLLKGTN
jgi:hypothetical protein